MHQYDVTAIILSHNSDDLLTRCLTALATSNGLSVEIIVVDNGSTDDTIEAARRASPDIRLIASPTNIGYAAGNNLAISLARGRYLAFVNVDAFVEPQTLVTMVGFLDANPAVGVAGPRLVYPDGSPQPYSYGADPTIKYLIRRAVRRAVRRRPMHDWTGVDPQPVDWVSGACLLVRRELAVQTGGFDTDFFMYFEDTDWCRRIRNAGGHVYFVPTATAVHLSRPTYADRGRRRSYQESLVLYYHKHYGTTPAMVAQVLLWIFNLFERSIRERASPRGSGGSWPPRR